MKNPKSEALISKQYLNSKFQFSKLVCDLGFETLRFV